MKLFEWQQRRSERQATDPAPSSPGATAPKGSTPQGNHHSEVRIARTLVLSKPEAVDLVASEPRLLAEDVEVTLTEKGFGTRIAIVAQGRSGLEEADLEQLIDRLAKPQKRPFSNG